MGWANNEKIWQVKGTVLRILHITVRQIAGRNVHGRQVSESLLVLPGRRNDVVGRTKLSSVVARPFSRAQPSRNVLVIDARRLERQRGRSARLAPNENVEFKV